MTQVTLMTQNKVINGRVPRIYGRIIAIIVRGNISGLLGLQCCNSGLKLCQLRLCFHQLLQGVHWSPSDRSAVVTVASIDEGFEVGLFEVPMVTVFPFEFKETTVGQIPHIPLGGFKFFCRLFKVQYIFHLQLEHPNSFVSPVAPGVSLT